MACQNPRLGPSTAGLLHTGPDLSSLLHLLNLTKCCRPSPSSLNDLGITVPYRPGLVDRLACDRVQFLVAAYWEQQALGSASCRLCKLSWAGGRIQIRSTMSSAHCRPDCPLITLLLRGTHVRSCMHTVVWFEEVKRSQLSSSATLQRSNTRECQVQPPWEHCVYAPCELEG